MAGRGAISTDKGGVWGWHLGAGGVPAAEGEAHDGDTGAEGHLRGRNVHNGGRAPQRWRVHPILTKQRQV
jgi:hypothetical protein